MSAISSEGRGVDPTPLPWTPCRAKGPDGRPCICRLIWSRAADRCVGSTRVSDCLHLDHCELAPGREESEANLRLILMAVNSYAALLAAARKAYVGTECGCSPKAEDGRDGFCTHCDLRAAICLAERDPWAASPPEEVARGK